MVYELLFELAAETLRTIAADPKHLGAQIGATLVLHTWGSALTDHPHVHGIVAGGGLSQDAERWVACKPGFFLPVRVLSRLFRRRFLEELAKAHHAGQLQFFGEDAALADAARFSDWLAPLREQEWVVYAKRPFAGPAAVLAYLSRYTHRVAISNRRLECNDASQFAVLRLRFGRFRLPRLEIAADPPGNAERHPRQKSLAPELVRPLIPMAIQALSDAHLTQRPSRCEEHRMRRCVDLPSRRCLRDRGQTAAGPEIGVRSSRRGKR